VNGVRDSLDYDSAVHFTMRLPTKRVAADCLVFDPAGRFLVVEPTYKSAWDVPGGVAEVDEPPRRAARREVGEELGLELEPGALLAVDWVAGDGDVTEVMAFLFDGGVIGEPAASLTLQADELGSARFVTLVEAEQLMDAEAFARVEAAIDARARQTTVYLECGREIDLAGRTDAGADEAHIAEAVDCPLREPLSG